MPFRLSPTSASELPLAAVQCPAVTANSAAAVLLLLSKLHQPAVLR